MRSKLLGQIAHPRLDANGTLGRVSQLFVENALVPKKAFQQGDRVIVFVNDIPEAINCFENPDSLRGGQ